MSNSLLQGGQLNVIYFSLNESVPCRSVPFVHKAEVVIATNDQVAVVTAALKDV